MNRPWLKWYPGDWRRDPALQSCSIAARGLWHEILMIAHDCTPYGFLKIGDKSPDNPSIARMTGCDEAQVARLLDELHSAGVFSRDEHGTIYSRRMVSDEKNRVRGVENGVKGGNPALRDKGVVIPPPDTRARASDSEIRVRSQSQKSESSSPSEREIEPVADAPAPLPKKPRSIPSTDHHQTIARWCDAYRDSQGESYDVQVKDAAAVKAMLKKHTPDEILAQADKLLFCESAFHAEHRTLSWLSAKWNEIGQLARANSLRLEGSGSKVVREAARMEASGARPLALDFLEENHNQKQITGRAS